MKIFIHDPTGYVGRVLSTKLKALDHELVVASDPSSPESIAHAVLLADVVYLDLTNPALSDQATQIITHLKTSELDHETTLVGISSVLTWNQTARSNKKAVKESSFKTRKSSLRYKTIKMLETMVMNVQKDGLRTYVVAPGILYGNGEDQLHELFRTAWMNDEPSLPVIGEGNNLIPLLHSSDLCSFLSVLLNSPPATQYMLAVDQAPISQLQLVQTIANQMGRGAVHHVAKNVLDTLENEASDDGGMAAAQRIDALTIDMRVAAEYLESVTGDFEWVAQSGFVEAFATVRSEYAQMRNLRPLRIFIDGPPGAGKSHWASRISKHYYLPHLHIGQLIQEAIDRHDDLSESITKALSEAATAVQVAAKPGKKGAPAGAAAAPAPAAAATGAVGKAGAAGGKKGATDDAPQAPRLPVSMLTQIVKRKLRESECRNKGFVLDGYPRTAEEALALWKREPEGSAGGAGGDEDGAGGGDDGAGSGGDADASDAGDDADGGEGGASGVAATVPKDPSTMVDFAVLLSASESVAAQRMKELPESEVRAGHNDESSWRRRWTRWQQIHDTQTEQLQSPLTVIPEVEVLELPEQLLTSGVDGSADAASPPASLDRAFVALSAYLERGGKPFNYHPTPAEQAATLAALEAAEFARRERERLDLEQKQQLENELKQRKAAQAEERKEAIEEEDSALVEACSLPLRTYLMQNVVPAVVDGLVDLCKVQPDDPVDYLATWLYKYSLNAPLDRRAPSAPAE